MLSVAGGVIRAWTNKSSDVADPWAFGSDCFMDSKITYANVFGVRTPVFIGYGTKDYLNRVLDMELRVQGVGLVALNETVPNPKQSIHKQTVLVRFNERNVRIRSWEPFELVYE